MEIVFFGTPLFAAKVLSRLVSEGIVVKGVVTRLDQPKGRSLKVTPSPVKQFVQKTLPHVPLFQPKSAKDSDFFEMLKQIDVSYFIVVAYGEILKKSLLDLPRKCSINLHASLLPKYRGAAPIQRALMNGEEITGATVMQMVEKMDAGPILKAVEMSVPPNATFSQIEEELLKIGSKALVETLHELEKDQCVEIVQDEDEATYAPKIEPEEGEVHWNFPAFYLHNLIRALNPKPGAWCKVVIGGEERRLKILKSQVVFDPLGEPGKILKVEKEAILVGCGEGSLRILELQLEGKKAMKASDLFRGNPLSFFED